MHLLFVTGEYPPMQGGVGAYTAELGRALISAGLRVSVLTSSYAKDGDNSPDYPQSYPQIHRWGWGIVEKVATYAQSIGADWLHVQYQTAAFQMHPAINFAPYLWRRRGLRVAWTYHDLLVPYLFPKAGLRLRRWVTERPAFASHFTVVTNEADFCQLEGRVQRLAQIPIGSNVRGQELSVEERRKRRQMRGYSDDELVIAYFGFLNRSKGGITLVETLQRLVEEGRNAHLLMIGERVGASDPTNYRYLQEVEACIAELELSARVRWTGHQADMEVGADLNAADLLLMPYVDGVSLRRGTLMAGLANGCAIVTTTPEDPLPELMNGENLLTVPPEDPAAAAAAVMQIADDPALAQRLRTNARLFSQRFRWEAIAAQHLTLYAPPQDLGVR
jgi:glycosyltransferase involved in cell wall biosynthesis